MPDLKLDYFKYGDPIQTSSGFGISISIGIINVGGADAAEFKLSGTYTDANGREVLTPLLNSGRVFEWYLFSTGSLAPGEVAHFSGNLLLPADAVDGISTDIYITIDSCASDEFFLEWCRVLESDESNNVVKVGTFTFKPDLVITEAVQLSGQTITLGNGVLVPYSVTVRNQGTAAARGQYVLGVEYVNANGFSQVVPFQVSDNVNQTTPQIEPGLEAGESMTIAGYLFFTGGVVPSEVTAIVDDCRGAGGDIFFDYCLVDELDESNNRVQSKVSRSIPGVVRPVDIDLNIPILVR